MISRCWHQWLLSVLVLTLAHHFLWQPLVSVLLLSQYSGTNNEGDLTMVKTLG